MDVFGISPAKSVYSISIGEAMILVARSAPVNSDFNVEGIVVEVGVL